MTREAHLNSYKTGLPYTKENLIFILNRRFCILYCNRTKKLV